METMDVWDLSVLYESMDDPAFSSDIEEAARGLAEACRDVRSLGASPAADDFAALFGRIDRALNVQDKVVCFRRLVLMTDVENAAALGFSGRIDKLESMRGELLSLLAERIAALANPEALAAAPALSQYRDYLLRVAAQRAHRLPPAQEHAIHAMQQNGGEAWFRLRNRLDASMVAVVKSGRQSINQPINAVRGLAFSRATGERLEGYRAELSAYAAHRALYADCLNAIKGEALALADLRNYPSVLAWMLDISRMRQDTLEALLKAVRTVLPAMRRYLRAKAALLGHRNGIPYYELYAPLGAPGDAFTLKEAGSLLTEVFRAFSPDYGAFIENAFACCWIDATPRAGKQGGALCAPLSAVRESRVFCNFDGSLAGVLTLAHELGHAWHDRCTFDVPLLVRDAPTPVCETASTFAETLVYGKMLSLASDEERLYLLDALLSGAARNTVDIYSRFLFEDELFTRRKEAPLSGEALDALMLRCQKEAYADALDSEAMHPSMWIVKPHYYIPNFHYYNFPYAFGLLFALGLNRLYEKEPAGFAARYAAMLGKTCSSDVEQAAAEMNIDLADPAFWSLAAGELERYADLFCSIAQAQSCEAFRPA